MDEHVVEFNLKKPNSPFIANLSMEFSSILSKEYADKMMAAGTPELLDTRPIGTGPFIFKSYDKDSIIRYVANPAYYGDRKALVDKLVFVITPDNNVRTQKIKTGECHIIAEPTWVDYKDFEKDKNLVVKSATGLNIAYLAFNTKKKPFDNIKVRKAIFHALNRAPLIEAIYQGQASVAESAIPSSTWGFNNNLPTYEHDVEKSKSLLKEAGYPDGFETEIWALPVSRPYNPDGRKMAEIMQADLSQVGIKAKIVSYDWPTYLSKSKKGEHEMIQLGWTSDNGDPDNFFTSLLSCSAAEAGSNRALWCHKPFDDLIQKAKRVSDVDLRTELYMDSQKVFKEQAPWVPLVSAKIFRVTRANVKGFTLDPLGRDYFDGVDLQ